MFSERYGVNIKIVPKISKILLLTLMSVGLGFFGSCGKKSDSGSAGQDATVASNAKGGLSEEEIIEEMMNEVLVRLRYGDKSGLYENEFEYSNDETSFDEYLGMGQIRFAQADTITFVEVRHVKFFDHDSALVDVTVHFEGPTGQKSYYRDKVVVYYHRGRWIKPTVSVIDLQVNYEEMIRVADSAAEAEAEELY
jgi:hypothetical protein